MIWRGWRGWPRNGGTTCYTRPRRRRLRLRKWIHLRLTYRHRRYRVSVVELTTPATAEPDPAVDETPKNVLPFRSPTEPKSPTLTPGESNAFDELARRLSARLEGASEPGDVVESAPPSASRRLRLKLPCSPDRTAHCISAAGSPAAARERDAGPAIFGSPSARRAGLWTRSADYGNGAFLDATGYDSLHALSEAGGLDALFRTRRIDSQQHVGNRNAGDYFRTKHGSGRPADARLFAISWDGEQRTPDVYRPLRNQSRGSRELVLPNGDSTMAEELTVLDTAAEGIVMFDGLGRVVSCNRSAEALFGRDDGHMTSLNLIDLFAPESQRGVLDYIKIFKGAIVQPARPWPRRAGSAVRDGGIIPLSITMGRTRPDGARFS